MEGNGFIGGIIDLLHLCRDEESYKKVEKILTIMYDMSDEEIMRVARVLVEAEMLFSPVEGSDNG